jgi:hypothetical protein
LLGQLIWWFGIALECTLLMRGWLGRWAPRYRVFYFYILFVLSQELLRFLAYQRSTTSYFHTYWITEFLGVLAGCGIVFETYKAGLSAYPGVARMARNLLIVIFVLTFTKAFVDSSSDPRWWLAASTMELERDARVVQAVAIAALIGLFTIYAVPFGRNLRGIVFGYGIYVAISIATLRFAAFRGSQFSSFWQYLVPASFLFTLVFWVAHLWSFQPQPAPAATARLEHDYQKVAAATRRRLQEARGYLGKATL